MSDDSDIKGLSNQQVLKGIEDIVREKFGWTFLYLWKEDKIAGVILGVKSTVRMFETKKKGEMIQ